MEWVEVAAGDSGRVNAATLGPCRVSRTFVERTSPRASSPPLSESPPQLVCDPITQKYIKILLSKKYNVDCT